jgi:hypothetical protein
MANYLSHHPPATCFSHPPTPNFDTPTEQDWEARSHNRRGQNNYPEQEMKQKMSSPVAQIVERRV